VSSWHWLRRRPIVTRLVVSVAVAMAVVLVLSAAFVYWRVEFALNRQLDQDLEAWDQVVDRSLSTGARPPADTPGLKYQEYDERGRLVAGTPGLPRLASPRRVRAVARGDAEDYDVGSFIPPSSHPYRVRPGLVRKPDGRRVVLAVISRSKHDEALRELLLQLGIADFIALLAASLVGYRTARAALDPVEAYRRAAQEADAESGGRLPVEERDDELSRLGHTLNALLARIEAGADRERQFIADAAHELRTPLTLMTSELEWAGHRPRTAEETSEVLDSLRGQVARLVELANALLELEELRAGQSLRLAPVSLCELVDDAVRDAVPAHTSVHVDVPDVVVTVDRRWLGIAIVNLVRNARQHGSPPISVTARYDDSGLRLVVSDAGPGFPDEFREHAFERFAQADSARSSGGSGLGLALVSSVAQAHGGFAEVLDDRHGRVGLSLPLPV
jgi:two-component system, OmpR family, sensor kinase